MLGFEQSLETKRDLFDFMESCREENRGQGKTTRRDVVKSKLCNVDGATGGGDGPRSWLPLL